MITEEPEITQLSNIGEQTFKYDLCILNLNHTYIVSKEFF
jgi:hypothetical protein